MKRWFAKSLKRKLILLVVPAILFPLLSTGVVSYQIASSVSEAKAKQAGENTLRQMTDKLAFYSGCREYVDFPDRREGYSTVENLCFESIS